MSKFKRRKPPASPERREEVRSQLTGKSGESISRVNKGIPPATAEDKKVCDVYVAQHMLKSFGWKGWMEGIIDKPEAQYV